MGCDIHAVLEVRKGAHGEWYGAKIGPCRTLTRHYGIFGAIAGVRCYTPESLEPRGFPADASYNANAEYYDVVVVGDDSPRKGTVIGNELYLGESDARKWIDAGTSEERDIDGVRRISSPDWHTPSWIATDELGDALKWVEYIPLDWDILLGVMRSYENEGLSCRLVFWFDN